MTSWREGAECASRAALPTLFDWTLDDNLTESSQARASRHGAALVYCQTCPVRAECLADAIARGDAGVRGGVVLGGRAGLSAAGRRAMNEGATDRARADMARRATA